MSRDSFVSIGLDWDYGLDAIAALKRETGMSVVLGCYDTIPIDYPEVSSRSTRTLFEDYFLRVGCLADKIFAISETSKADLQSFYRRAGRGIAPPITAILLGSSEPRTACSDAGEDAVLRKSKQGFVLYVSTIEARKNHRVLIQVWRELHSRYGREIPTLVLVGMPGWGVRDLLEELESMAVFRDGCIHMLNHASDALVGALYQQCLFAVFPSIYEGWGLGAVEAMRYGKMCIVSEAPALVEATQGLCPAIHPFDFLGWRDAIIRYWQSPSQRAVIEERIKSLFRVRTWQDFGRDFRLFLGQT